MWAGVSPSSGADVAGVSPSPGADVGRGEPQFRRRCGGGEPPSRRRCGRDEPQSRRRCGGATTSPIRAAGHSAHSAGLQTRSLGGYCEYFTRLQILRRRQRNVLLHGLPKVVRRERLVAHLHTNKHTRNKQTNARVLNPAAFPPRLLTAQARASWCASRYGVRTESSRGCDGIWAAGAVCAGVCVHVCVRVCPTGHLRRQLAHVDVLCVDRRRRLQPPYSNLWRVSED